MNSLMLSMLLLAAPVQSSEAKPPYDTIVICPEPFLTALRPWAAHRVRQGHRVALSSDTSSPESIRNAIRQAAEGGGLKYVVLVGDDDPRRTVDRRVALTSVPTQRVKARVNVLFGSEPHIASDNWYADLDGDQVPDVAIGRLTADSPQELSAIIQKIIDYESCINHAPWRRKINIIAGVGGFGPLIDSMIDTTTKRLVTSGIPAGYETSMTYASVTSPYCPDPRRLPETTLSLHNEGCLFWVYMGHGQRKWLDYMRIGENDFRIFDVRDVPRMRSQCGSPIALMLACYTGAFDEPEDCLAEQMLKTPGAPVAVICGSRVTMPYANAVLGFGLLDEYFNAEHATLGDLLLAAKRSSVDETKKTPGRKVLDTVAAAVSPTGDQLQAERLEHLHLYHLLGDPLLSLRKPEPVAVTTPEYGTAGGTIEISGESSVAGKCIVELVCRRDRLTFSPEKRREVKIDDAAFQALHETYHKANNQTWVAKTMLFDGGSFTAKLPIPADCNGPCHVRVYIEGNQKFALGSADVYVRKANLLNRGAE